MMKPYYYAILFSLALMLGVSTQAAAQNKAQPDNSQQQPSQQQPKQQQPKQQQQSESNGQSSKKQDTGNGGNASAQMQSANGQEGQGQQGGQFITVQKSSQVLASSIIGMTIQNGTGKKAESIGTVSDLIMNKQHQLTGIVVGIGGFLGIGQKQVGMPWSEVKNINLQKGVAVVSVTKKQLQDAPSFTTKEEHKQKQKQQRQQQKLKQQQSSQ